MFILAQCNTKTQGAVNCVFNQYFVDVIPIVTRFTHFTLLLDRGRTPSLFLGRYFTNDPLEVKKL